MTSRVQFCPSCEYGIDPRQIKILKMVAKGQTTEQIAKTLHLAQVTIKRDLRLLFVALGVSNRPHAVAEALRLGLI